MDFFKNKLIIIIFFLISGCSSIPSNTSNSCLIFDERYLWYKHTKKVEKLYRFRFNNCNLIHTDSKTAEFIKYFGNIFFAVKVSFANEMRRISDLVGVDWNAALAGFVADARVADSHLRVPGPDGKKGFGGSCFPKDINAFITFCESLGVNANVIKAAWKTNLEVRPEKDWEDLKGRAVTN